MDNQPTVEQLLAAVQAEQLRFHRQPQPPLTEAAKHAFYQRAAATFAYELPPAYQAILSITDGLDWNGILLYASATRQRANGDLLSQGLVEANIQLRLGYTPDKDFIYFAESGLDAYRHNLLTAQFEVADRVVADSVFATFATADELFRHLLEKMLEVGEDDEDADF